MAGFRYCSWCNGKGCMCCDAEEKAWVKKAAANAPKWRKPDIRDLRNQELADATKFLESQIGVTISSQEEFSRLEAELHARIEEAYKPALDAEYARQFPNGITPIFTARADNANDMELLKRCFHRTVIEQAFGPDGGGMDEIEERCAKARAEQDPPIEYKPFNSES